MINQSAETVERLFYFVPIFDTVVLTCRQCGSESPPTLLGSALLIRKPAAAGIVALGMIVVAS
jgi:hypothetical protein